MTFCRHALLCAIAAVLAVAAPSVRAADDAAAARNMLNVQLPAGVTLAKASIDQTAGAVRAAVARTPAMGTSILQAALMAKEPKQGRGKLPCPEVTKLTRAAIASDSADTSKLVDTASSMHPECADALGTLLAVDRGEDSAGLLNTDITGFGAGFGPGFPGSPGFVGSAPSGAFALPPAPPVVTSTTNS